MVRTLLVTFASALLTACAVGPDYVRPSVAVPERFAQAGAAAASGGVTNGGAEGEGAAGRGAADHVAADGGAAADHRHDHVAVDEAAADRAGSGSNADGAAEAEAEGARVDQEAMAFWRRFDDPLLSQLVEEALAANHDLRIGLARWEEANALLRQSRFDRVPTVTAGGVAANTRASESQLPGVARGDRDADVFEARADASWELDLFGRVRRQVDSQRALADAAAADLRGIQVAIVGELAVSYLRLRGTQARLEVARINADNQRETLRIVQARVDTGQGTDFDTARARAQLWSTLARIPALESAIALDMHRIAVLTGRTPDALLQTLAPVRDLPVLLSPPDAGTPGDLLRRRPDIAAAERRLAAASERIGIATADLFPRLVLGGAIGSQALDADALFERDSETRLISLGIDWSFLDAGRVRAHIAAAQARADEHLAHYQQTVLQALEEAESALAVHRGMHEEMRRLAQAADASARATGLARIQFDGGLVELLQVLDAERIQLDAEDRLAQAMSASAVALVGVYRAIGGGWPDRLPAGSESPGSVALSR
jgi:multidrug efflux system outer membrane protein